MKTFTVIGGVNGTGKSSLSGVLSFEKNDLGIIIDTDKLTAQLGSGNISGGRAALRKIEECLAKGIDFTQETTLSGSRTLKTIQRAAGLDYFIRLYYIGIGSYEESLVRIKARAAKGGHDIPAEDVKRRFEKRFDDLARVLPYCREVVFYDNENGFRAVGEYRNGSLGFIGDDTPLWLREFREYLEKN